jgi:hypothetical protein
MPPSATRTTETSVSENNNSHKNLPISDSDLSSMAFACFLFGVAATVLGVLTSDTIIDGVLILSISEQATATTGASLNDFPLRFEAELGVAKIHGGEFWD